MKKLLSLFTIHYSLLTLASLAMLVASCGTSMPTQFYSLSSSTDTIKTISSKKVMIGIDVVNVAGYVERPQIVTIESANQIQMSEYNRWAESLNYSIQRTVADNVSAHFKNGIAKPLTSNRSSYDYIVQIELNKFDGKFNDQAQLDVWWTIIGANRTVLTREHSRFTTPIGNTYDDLVAKQSELVSKLSEAIAKKISKL